MIEIKATSRGFYIGEFLDAYNVPSSIQESSAIDNSDDALDNPGSSFLWLGCNANRMHLNRSQVKELVSLMTRWLETKTLEKQP